MFDWNWDLINGPQAHEIEILNYANQVNVIEALFHYVTALHPYLEGVGFAGGPNTNALKALHHAGTLFLLERPGEFREANVHVAKANGEVVHQPPEWTSVAQAMADFDQDLHRMWQEATPVQIAAFALWKINWVHPFKNGNGRSARAFAYACLCLKYGFMLPGQKTVIDLIMLNKPEYEAALGHADKSFAAAGSADLQPMEHLVERLLIEQFQSIPDAEIEAALAQAARPIDASGPVAPTKVPNNDDPC